MALIRHRETARVLIQAQTGRFLLLYTLWDPGSGLEARWVSPGGGIEPEEELQIAAAREIFEETGLRLDSSQLGSKIGELQFTQTWINGDHETGIAHFFHHVVNQEFEVDKSSWTEEEKRDILEIKWWNLQDLQESGATVGPPGLVELMAQLAS